MTRELGGATSRGPRRCRALPLQPGHLVRQLGLGPGRLVRHGLPAPRGPPALARPHDLGARSSRRSRPSSSRSSGSSSRSPRSSSSVATSWRGPSVATGRRSAGGRSPAWGSACPDREGPLDLVGVLLAGVGTAFALSIPFALWPWDLARKIVTTAAQYSYLTVNAYNPWALLSQDGNGVAANGTWVLDAPNTQYPDQAWFTFGPLPAVVVGTALLLAMIARALRRRLAPRRSPDPPRRAHGHGDRVLHPADARPRALHVPVLRAWRDPRRDVVPVARRLPRPRRRELPQPLRRPRRPLRQPRDRRLAGHRVTPPLGAGRGGGRTRARRRLPLGSHAAETVRGRAGRGGSQERRARRGGRGRRGPDTGAAGPTGRPGPATAAAAAAAARPPEADATDGEPDPGRGPIGWLRGLARYPVRDRSWRLARESGGKIDRLDIWILVVLVVAALVLRTYRLAEPYRMHFDEVYHARTATEFLQFWRYGEKHDIYEYTHPHLAKYAIAAGIVVAGNNRVTSTSDIGAPVLDAVDRAALGGQATGADAAGAAPQEAGGRPRLRGDRAPPSRRTTSRAAPSSRRSTRRARARSRWTRTSHRLLIGTAAGVLLALETQTLDGLTRPASRSPRHRPSRPLGAAVDRLFVTRTARRSPRASPATSSRWSTPPPARSWGGRRCPGSAASPTAASAEALVVDTVGGHRPGCVRRRGAARRRPGHRDRRRSGSRPRTAGR